MARSRPTTLLAALLFTTPSSCAPTDPESESHEGPAPSGPVGQGGDDGSFDGGAAEPCNGFDDDQDGEVDEGCACEAGSVQACFLAAPDLAGVGICVAGQQVCLGNGSGEFGVTEWSDCVGAVGPALESCGDGVDSDCDGEDPACDSTGSGGAGGAGSGGGGSGGGSGCTPTTEVCENGIDEDCDGADDSCDVIEVDLFLFGDCITASCPPSHPHPVGCNVLFSPGDDRGCVAHTSGSAVVYFQAGDECSAGFIGGTMSCSTSPGVALGASNCPINKPIPIYASDPSGCPEIQD